jgi:solute carrier family 35 protein E1
VSKKTVKMSLKATTVKWFMWSTVHSVFNKRVLEGGMDIGLITSVQLLIATVFAFCNYRSSFSSIQQTLVQMPRAQWIPALYALCIVCMGQWFGNHFANVAISSLTVASVSIIKSSEPLLAMVYMSLLHGQRFSIQKIALVLPVIGGIVLSTKGDMSYTHIGAMLCIGSNLAHIVKTVHLKTHFCGKLGLNSVSAFVLSTSGSLALSMPCLVSNAHTLLVLPPDVWFNLLASGIGYFYTSAAAFDIIMRVSPVTFSVLNIYKRLVIIFSAFLLSRQSPSVACYVGLLISNIGLYLYAETP